MSIKMNKFISTLTCLGFDPKDVAKWKCVGCGDKPEGMIRDHVRQKMWEDWSRLNGWICNPDNKDECLCGHSIRYNYYITSNDEHEGRDVLVVGSCCMRQFLEDGMRRHCDTCRVVHKRTKNNICFDCENKEKEIKREKKEITCKCGKMKKKEYKSCYTCKFPPNPFNTSKKTCKCGKFIASNYIMCYNCKMGGF